MTKSEEKTKAVQKMLSEPVCEFDSRTQRVRTSLAILSIVGIVLSYGDLELTNQSSIFGLKFNNLNGDLVRDVLSVLLIYFLLHFTWRSIDAFLEWRLRLTGLKVLKSVDTTQDRDDSNWDYPINPRQSTLYNWWKEKAQNPVPGKDEILSGLEKVVEVIEKNGNEKELYVHFNNLQSYRSELLQAEKIIKSERIPSALEQFDNWFLLFQKSQNIRWFLFDFLLPLVLGVVAFVWLQIDGGIF